MTLGDTGLVASGLDLVKANMVSSVAEPPLIL